MANNEILLTAKGFAELEEELNELRTTKREENIQAIKKLEVMAIYLRIQNTMLPEMSKLKLKLEYKN